MPGNRGGSLRFRPEDEPNDLTDCENLIAQWPKDLQDFAPDVVVVATGPTNTAWRQVPGDDEWRGMGDPVLDKYQLAQMQEDVDELSQTGARVVRFDMPYEQRDQGEGNGATVLSSSDPARIDRYNQLLSDLEATRPVSILRWSTYFDAQTWKTTSRSARVTASTSRARAPRWCSTGGCGPRSATTP